MLADHDGLKMAVKSTSWVDHCVEHSHVSTCTVHACANKCCRISQARSSIQTLTHHAGARELHEKCIELLNCDAQAPLGQLVTAEAERVLATAQEKAPSNNKVLEDGFTH